MIERNQLQQFAGEIVDELIARMKRLEEAWKSIKDSDGSDHNAWLSEIVAATEKWGEELKRYIWD